LDTTARSVIDADSHVLEPADLWTSRVPSKYAESVPHVAVEPTSGHRHWRVGDAWLWPVGFWAQAGWKDYPPLQPWEYEDAERGSYDPKARLAKLDEYGIEAQVLYPNLIGFQAPRFEALGPELALLCTAAYNDYLLEEWAAADRKRFVPIAMLPFWDLEASVKEMQRCVELGHKGILFANKFERVDLPNFCDPYWDPVYAAAQEMDIPVNFHIGFTLDSAHKPDASVLASRRDNLAEARKAKSLESASLLMGQCDTLGKLLTSGLCRRFPRLKLVSVETGFGQVPFYLEALDWHWKAHGNPVDDLLPSEYFTRQCYGTLWFERTTLALLEQYPDNFMFSTDYPHPTSLSPGPASPAELPKDHIEHGYAGLDPTLVDKVLSRNAKAVYGL